MPALEANPATDWATRPAPKDHRSALLAVQRQRRVPRGLVMGMTAAVTLAWGGHALRPGAWPGVISPVVQTALYLALGSLTVCSRKAKVLLVRTVQRDTLKPLMRLFLQVGFNPVGLAVLESRVTAPALYVALRSATAGREHLLDHRRAWKQGGLRAQYPA